jgi:hypothetical protein
MSELHDYWQSTHDQLQRRRETWRESHEHLDCRLIANNIAALLREDGRKPVFYFLDDIDQEGNGHFLVPLGFDGYHLYAGHVVCVAEEIAYDPLLQEPIAFGDYPVAAFGKQLVITQLAEEQIDRTWMYDSRKKLG